MRSLLIFGVCILLLGGLPVDAAPQMRPLVQARVEGGSISSGNLGTEQSRRGVSLLVGADGLGGSVRFALSHVPEGSVEPGWNAAVIEIGPAIAVDSTLLLSARLAGGGYRTNVDNRHEVIAGCRWEEGCMFEAPSFESGWAVIGGASVEAALTVFRGIGVSVGYRWGRLWKGANDGELRSVWSAGVTYTFR